MFKISISNKSNYKIHILFRFFLELCALYFCIDFIVKLKRRNNELRTTTTESSNNKITDSVFATGAVCAVDSRSIMCKKVVKLVEKLKIKDKRR